jgi:hypothetical protein
VRDRVDDGRVERLVPVDRPAQLLVDGLREVLPLGGVVEDVLPVDVGAGGLEIVLGLLYPMGGDRGDGVRSRHRTPCCVLVD